MDDGDRLVELLARHAYREGDFVLSSGRRSQVYLDAKQVTHRPDGARAVGLAMVRLLEPLDVAAVGGLTMGADAIVTATVVASEREERPLTGFVVRKEPKGHGLGKWIEGVSPSGLRTAVVDDVITTAGSALRAVERAREAGAEVVVVVGLVDREEGGAEAVRATGIEYRALTTLARIRAAAHAGRSDPGSTAGTAG